MMIVHAWFDFLLKALDPIAKKVGQTLRTLRDFVIPIRVSLIVIGIGTLATLLVPQVREVFRLVNSHEGAVHFGLPQISLWLSCAFAGFGVWYQARNAYRFTDSRTMRDLAYLQHRQWIPRILSCAVPALVLIGLFANAGDSEPWVLWINASAIVAVLIFLIGVCMRRQLLNMLPSSALSSMRLLRFEDEDRQRIYLQMDARKHPVLGTAKKTFFWATTINIIVFVLLCFSTGSASAPAWLDWLNRLGPLAYLLFAGGFFCIVGGFLSTYLDYYRVPLLTVLFAIAAFWHALHWNDNHAVRIVEEHKFAVRNFEQYTQAKIDSACGKQHEQVCTVVLVSAEGGGIRAGAWTALLLSSMEQLSNGELSKRMIATSGVSGGSLGLAGYVGWLKSSANNPGASNLNEFVAHDYLGPTLANTFFVDFTQRLLPTVDGIQLPDRGRALTANWEHQWQAQFKNNIMQQSLYELYADSPLLPALFLNSTSVQSGERFIQHPFTALPSSAAWASSIDGASYCSGHYPLSEAVLNSARFSYVSPAGSLHYVCKQSFKPTKISGNPDLQVVDGGYYENSGTSTLRDVLHVLRKQAGKRPLRIIVLHISNDPHLPELTARKPNYRCVQSGRVDCMDSEDSMYAKNAAVNQLRGDLSAPVISLLKTRESRGAASRQALYDELTAGDLFCHLRLDDAEGNIPLGWTLSNQSMQTMQTQIKAIEKQLKLCLP